MVDLKKKRQFYNDQRLQYSNFNNRTRQKISKETEELDNTKTIRLYIHRTLYLPAEYMEHSPDDMIVYKTSCNTF